MFKQTAITNKDSYKIGHADQYPVGTTKVYSNFTPRSDKYFDFPYEYKDHKVVWFGLQAFLQELIHVYQTTFFDREWEELQAEISSTYAPFVGANCYDTSRMKKLWELGYLPLEIKSLPEGSRVNIGVPVLTIVNTHPDFSWVTNDIETWLSTSLWKMTTSATSAFALRKLLTKYAELTGGSKDFMDWQFHDFSPRGMSNIEDAAKCGAGHLLSFRGTDNLPSVKYIKDVYKADKNFLTGSVPATEHATMAASIMVESQKIRQEGTDMTDEQISREAEKRVFKRLITEVYPSGIVSIVSDTYDFWYVITNIVRELKEDILNRKPDQFGNAKLVCRPDSGDPVKILTGYTFAVVEDIRDYYQMLDVSEYVYEAVFDKNTGKYYEFSSNDDGWSTEFEFTEISEAEAKGAVQCLDEIFGSTVNDKGYKTLNPRIGLIYGDSITPNRADEILRRLADKGYASDNVVFGIGSYHAQMKSRDSLGMAVKCTYVEVNGQGIEVFKDPKTDDGTKKSARGLLRVEKVGDDYVLFDRQTEEQEKQGCLETVFKNGKILKFDTFETIRERVQAELSK